MNQTRLPAALTACLADFEDLSPADRLTVLLEYGDDLPALPEQFADPAATMERVAECQTPVYIAVVAAGRGARLHVSAPAQAPVTRGFAGLLVELIPQLTFDEVGALPIDLPLRLGLGEAISPLRLRGMTGLLRRVQKAAQTVAGAAS